MKRVFDVIERFQINKIKLSLRKLENTVGQFPFKWRHDSQHIDIQHNYTQHN